MRSPGGFQVSQSAQGEGCPLCAVQKESAQGEGCPSCAVQKESAQGEGCPSCAVQKESAQGEGCPLCAVQKESAQRDWCPSCAIQRKIRRSWLLACVCLLAAACNRTHKATIAVVPKASADIFWQSVHAGAVKGGWDSHVDIVWDGPPNETDIAGEMKIMETMIDRRVDAIALAPSDRSAFKIVVDRAAAAGIPIVIYDSGIDTDNYATFVATDNYLGGQMAADRLGKVLNGSGKIVMVKTVPGGASTMAREDGFRHELKAKFPAIQILDERFGMAMISEARKVTENMLTAHPDLNGIFSSNESGSEGAAQTLKSRGSKIKLVGFDSSPMLLTLLREGWIDSLVIQDPFKMGETAVDEAARALRREKTPKKIFLPPRVVNLSNLNDSDVEAQLHPDLKRYLGAY